MVWQDRRSADLCAGLADHADRLAAITGLSLDPYFAAPKMAWLRAQGHRGGVVTTSDAWLVHQLTGAFVTDASTASRTLLLDLDAVGWSPEALDVFGLGPTKRSPRSSAARPRWARPRRSAAAVPAHRPRRRPAGGALRRGLPRGGLGEVHVRHRGVPARPRRGRCRSAPSAGLPTSVAWQVAGATDYCLDGQVYTVASAVRWLTDLGVIAGPTTSTGSGSTVDGPGGVVLVPVARRPRRPVVGAGGQGVA